MWGPWQVGQMTKEVYAAQAYQWAKALKLLDPSIQLILCGEDGTSEWDDYVLKECIKWDVHGLGGSTTASLISMHSIHIYTASKEHLPNATGTLPNLENTITMTDINSPEKCGASNRNYSRFDRSG
jgi:alpha-N-arabinofuranosidase